MSNSLFSASLNGDLEAVKCLISQGADVNEKGSSGFTPLYSTVIHDNLDMAKLLISEGADVHIKNIYGETPLHFSCETYCVEIIREMILKGISLDIDFINEKNIDGNTPLHKASRFGHVKVVELLISNGANINERNINGNTPLYSASYDISDNRVEVMKCLISYGADYSELIEKYERNGNKKKRDELERIVIEIGVNIKG